MRKRSKILSELFAVLLLIVSLSNKLSAQHKFTISGTVRDAVTGEMLVGASIKFIELKGGASTNSYGFFSITVPAGSYSISASYVGYQQKEQTFVLSTDLQLDLRLQPNNTLQEVIVTNRKKHDNLVKPMMGVEKLEMNTINKLPVLLGERDVLKSMQLLPGIKSAGEGNSGFYVRGGAADQNLVLLDEAPVYNASHLLGFFSTFNSDAIKDVTLFKGGMPAQYGGRLSSVVDIKMKDGNNKKLDVSGGLGLISSRLNIEGPIVKEKGSFIVSGRRSYADMFLKLSADTSLKNNQLYFYDLNLKANYRLGKKDRIFLSGYFGRDVLGFGNTFNTDWGNTTGTLRWNHVLTNRIFSNTSVIYSDYSYRIKFTTGEDKLSINSKIRDLNIKQDFDLFINNNSKIKFGAQIIKHIVSPARIVAEGERNTTTTVQDRHSWEGALYGSHEVRLTDHLNVTYGIRISNLTATGPGDYYSYDKDGNVAEVLSYKKGKVAASYWNAEPRLSASYQLASNRSIKVSYNRNVQNLHLLSNSTSSSPTDLWLPSSNNVRPEIADQFAVGYYQNLREDKYELSAEAYYKAMQNQIDYKSGALLQANDHIESELVYGRGRAYGIEFLLKKKTGRLHGWLGYTLSKTERSFEEINNGKYFNAKQDRTHDVSVVGIYALNERWSLSGTFVYSTGNAVTFPSGKYRVNEQTVFVYTDRNGHRMPAYHRLDLAAAWESKRNKFRKYQSTWTFGLYNVYGRENAFSINFKDDPSDPTRTIAEQTSLFKFVPAITWNFKF